MATNGIEFEDGTTLSTEDWFRILSVIKQRAKEGKPNPVAISQGGVTINVKGYAPVAKGKVKGQRLHEHEQYVEATHEGWKIRVWRKEREQVYGCNYYRDEDVRYLEVPFGDVRDENGVFKYAMTMIDDL